MELISTLESLRVGTLHRPPTCQRNRIKTHRNFKFFVDFFVLVCFWEFDGGSPSPLQLLFAGGWRVAAPGRVVYVLFGFTESVLTVHKEDSRTSNVDGRLLVAYLFSVSSGLKPSFGLEVTRVKR